MAFINGTMAKAIMLRHVGLLNPAWEATCSHQLNTRAIPPNAAKKHGQRAAN